MKWGARVAVVMLVAAHGCTCYSFNEPVQTECGGLGQPCCTLGCNEGCNVSLFLDLECVAGKCSDVPVDAGPHDVHAESATCSSALACEDCSAAISYQPPMMGVPIATANACTQSELQAFATACFSSGATQQSCAAWQQQDSGACGACLAPASTSSATWGPIDCPSASACDANVGGCVDLVLGAIADERGQGGTGSCGDALSAALGCEDVACGACATGDVAACLQSSATNECASYENATASATGACAAIYGDAAPAAVSACFAHSDADQAAFLNVFCGTGP